VDKVGVEIFITTAMKSLENFEFRVEFVEIFYISSDPNGKKHGNFV